MLRDQLQEIFREVFDDPELEITDDMGPGVYEPWDSVETVQIVMGIEREFGIRLSVDEVAEVKSVGYILNLIESKKQS